MGKKLLTCILVLIIAYVIQKSYRHYLRKSATIYMKSKGSVDANLVRMLSYTDSVYKIQSNPHIKEIVAGESTPPQDKWDHIVFARAFPDDATLKNYVDALKHLQFVHKTEVVVMVPWKFPAHVVFNVFIRTWRVIGGWLGYLPKRPLAKSSTPIFKCEESMKKDSDAVMLFNIWNITDQAVFGTYAKSMFTQAYPALKANIYFTCDPAGERWNEFNMMAYESQRSWCELAESKLFEDNVKVKRKCVNVGDASTYVAKRLA